MIPKFANVPENVQKIVIDLVTDNKFVDEEKKQNFFLNIIKDIKEELYIVAEEAFGEEFLECNDKEKYEFYIMLIMKNTPYWIENWQLLSNISIEHIINNEYFDVKDIEKLDQEYAEKQKEVLEEQEKLEVRLDVPIEEEPKEEKKEEQDSDEFIKDRIRERLGIRQVDIKKKYEDIEGLDIDIEENEVEIKYEEDGMKLKLKVEGDQDLINDLLDSLLGDLESEVPASEPKKEERDIPDGTGPHGKGEGPGEGKGDGSGLEKKKDENNKKEKDILIEDKDKKEEEFIREVPTELSSAVSSTPISEQDNEANLKAKITILQSAIRKVNPNDPILNDLEKDTEEEQKALVVLLRNKLQQHNPNAPELESTKENITEQEDELSEETDPEADYNHMQNLMLEELDKEWKNVQDFDEIEIHDLGIDFNVLIYGDPINDITGIKDIIDKDMVGKTDPIPMKEYILKIFESKDNMYKYFYEFQKRNEIRDIKDMHLYIKL